MRGSRFSILSILIFLFLIGADPGAAQAQGKGEPAEPQFREATLKLGGPSCDVNQAEAALLRLKGVASVDVETRRGHLIVAYDPEKVRPNHMLSAISKKKGCAAGVVGDKLQPE